MLQRVSGLAGLRKLLTSMTFILLVIRLGGAGAGFGTQLVLARLLAPEDLGLFFAATSLAIVAATVVSFGYPEIAPRFIARYQERGRPATLAAFLHQAHRDSLRFSLFLALLILAAAMLWPGATAQARSLFAITALFMPILALFSINSGIALSLRAFFLAYGPETFLRPVFFLAIVAGMILVGASPDVRIVVISFFALTGMLAATQWLLLRARLPRIADGRDHADRRLVSRWRREGAPQIAVGIYTLIFADLAILLAATVLEPATLAAFGIALKLAVLVGFGVQVAHQVILPDLADARAARRLGRTSDTMRAAAAFPIAFTLAALIATALFGDMILAVFHPDFAQAHWVLVLLVACQVLRALAGPVVQLLTIAGAQVFNALLCIASTIVLALGNFALVPPFGLMGAGLAVLVAWLFWLGGSALGLYRITGMRCDIIALFAGTQQPASAPQNS
ncbi:lipopolysaccharide biosynthesis protein [Saliniramus sp.]|uniref:lipopolysaccharide biosynthesis protein n=1 Tax=Saliniramus sp. TaxID=2986772 RepID=UPI002CEB61E3|nr:oligosaccharide flippase family protein [Saliniramus sp.]HMB09614.1 oligosaccharide flippase family protein [Saliniramus sp.]